MVEATQTILPQPSRVIAVLAKQAAIGWARLCLRGRPGHSLSSRPSKQEKNDDREYSTAQPSPAIRASMNHAVMVLARRAATKVIEQQLRRRAEAKALREAGHRRARQGLPT
jgi:hypothetical protein